MNIARSLLTVFLVILTLCLASMLSAVLWDKVYCADFSVGTIQKAYEGIKDIKGSFVQKSTIKDLKRTDTFNGTFMIKVPSKVRWQYQGEGNDTEVIVDGGLLTIYQKSEKQVFKGRFDKESYGQAPLALIGGFGSIEKEFEAKKHGQRIVLTPRGSMGSVASVEVVPSEGDFPIGSLVIIDKRSNRIEITFKDVVLNSGIKDSAFKFTVPEGVSIYEHNQPR